MPATIAMRINVNFKLDGSIKYSLNDACVACGKNRCINLSMPVSYTHLTLPTNREV